MLSLFSDEHVCFIIESKLQCFNSNWIHLMLVSQ